MRPNVPTSMVRWPDLRRPNHNSPILTSDSSISTRPDLDLRRLNFNAARHPDLDGLSSDLDLSTA
jgi:hypothetical protein